jgi:hypothetical protein
MHEGRVRNGTRVSARWGDSTRELNEGVEVVCLFILYHEARWGGAARPGRGILGGVGDSCGTRLTPSGLFAEAVVGSVFAAGFAVQWHNA